MTHSTFAVRVHSGLAAQATSKILGDIGGFCNAAGRPDFTCYVISAARGGCSQGSPRYSISIPRSAG